MSMLSMSSLRRGECDGVSHMKTLTSAPCITDHGLLMTGQIHDARVDDRSGRGRKVVALHCARNGQAGFVQLPARAVGNMETHER
jgi:hypothetical protein